MTDKVGDDQAGFSFGYALSGEVFEVRAWGFWSTDVAAAFGAKVIEGLQRRLGSKRIVLDMSDLKPMREEGQQSLAHLFRSLSSLGVQTASIVTTSHLTKLQLVRIVTESGAGPNVQWLSVKAELTRDG